MTRPEVAGSFADVIAMMVRAVEHGDSEAVAACFTPDGIYHDVFYGDFKGRDAIARMIGEFFFRDGGDFRWDLHDPVQAGDIGYVRYVFSYASKLPGAEGRRAVFEGVAICRMRDGLIADYREVANAATGLHDVGFPDRRLARFVAKQAAQLRERPEAVRHLD